MLLPEDLQQAIEEELQNTSLRRVSKAAQDVSARYRTGLEGGDGKFVQSEEDSLAYAAYRLPATYAAISSALNEVKARAEFWEPESLLDVGSGPGTAMWAAADVCSTLKHITLLEKDENMLKLAKRFAKYSKTPSIQNVVWKKADLTRAWQTEPHDLVIASHVLGELPKSELEEIINRLWLSTAHNGILLIIEPAKSPRGFSLILQAREQLAANDAYIIAPCPRSDAHECPMNAVGRWCHFGQRVERSRLHRLVKKGFRPYEDVKFSYLAVSRLRGSAIEGRVILQPQVRSGYINLELCTAEGIQNVVVTKKQKEMFRKVRKLKWGAAIALDADEINDDGE